MNVPPKEFIRVMPNVLKVFVVEIYKKAGVSDEDANFLTDLLATNDLRGVFSHGTRQTAAYARLMRDGKVNPRPKVRLVDESPTTAIYDGDGGLGYFPSYRAAQAAVKKAKALGLGGAISRNHNHFGAAGIYSRVAMEADCIGFSVSAHRFERSTGSLVYSAGGGSPMSFAIPTGIEPPMVIDMATSFWPDRSEDFADVFSKMPAAFFKSFGLGAVCQALGGFMAGIWLFAKSEPGIWEAANQGAFILAVDVSRFMPIADFKRDMDEYVRSVRNMRPFPGYDRAELPGGLEWERERQWAKEGIPIGKNHQATLEEVAKEFAVTVPW